MHKEYTQDSHPKNKAIKALVAKGYKDIKLTWSHALSDTRGWTIYLNGKWVDRAYDVDNMMKKIEQLPNYTE